MERRAVETHHKPDDHQDTSRIGSKEKEESLAYRRKRGNKMKNKSCKEGAPKHRADIRKKCEENVDAAPVAAYEFFSRSQKNTLGPSIGFLIYAERP